MLEAEAEVPFVEEEAMGMEKRCQSIMDVNQRTY